MHCVLGVMHCDGDQAYLYPGFCWTIREILVVAIAVNLMEKCAAFTIGNGDICFMQIKTLNIYSTCRDV